MKIEAATETKVRIWNESIGEAFFVNSKLVEIRLFNNTGYGVMLSDSVFKFSKSNDFSESANEYLRNLQDFINAVRTKVTDLQREANIGPTRTI